MYFVLLMFFVGLVTLGRRKTVFFRFSEVFILVVAWCLQTELLVFLKCRPQRWKNEEKTWVLSLGPFRVLSEVLRRKTFFLVFCEMLLSTLKKCGF